MACGGCGGGNRSLRKQQVKRPQKDNKQKVIQQRVRKTNATAQASSVPKDTSVSIKRQSLVRDDRCPKCGNPVMLVNIAGRERKQCTNCRHILK